MNRWRYWSLFLPLTTILLFYGEVMGKEKRVITFDDFVKVKFISDLSVSPDGRMVAFTISTKDEAENKVIKRVGMVEIESGRLLNLIKVEGQDYSPAFSPAGGEVAFISERSGKPQIWVQPLKEGEEPEMVYDFPNGVDSFLYSPDGRSFAFTSTVYTDCVDEECMKKRNEEAEKSGMTAKLIDRLPIRFWNRWFDGKRSHLFFLERDGGKPRDLTPFDADIPPIDITGSRDYDFSPDGREIAFVMNQEKNITLSTNNDIFVVPVDGGEIRKISVSRAADNNPRYSPDGRFIAFRGMARPGFESDRYRLFLYRRGAEEILNLTEELDLSIAEFEWSPDSKRIFFTAQEKGYMPIFSLDIKGLKGKKLIEDVTCKELDISPDGRNLILLLEGFDRPKEIYIAPLQSIRKKKIAHITIKVGEKRVSFKEQPKRITNLNEETLKDIEWGGFEEFWYDGSGGTKVHGFLLTPPYFDDTKSYPTLFMIHGGPQGAWLNEFHPRWNISMFSSQGYVVVLLNPRGSTGYGQTFVDEISKDWGGKVYEDIMKGVEFVISKYPFVDSERLGALGASFGGYMVNWIAGHTDRFKCLVSHAGVFNLVADYGTTDVHWFPEWEFGGPYWESREIYEKFSPSNFVKNFKTPTLVICGQNDFRVSYTEGFQFFTALQRMGVPSKLLFFTDEDHFVTKPRNARIWWTTVFDFLSTYLKD